MRRSVSVIVILVGSVLVVGGGSVARAIGAVSAGSGPLAAGVGGARRAQMRPRGQGTNADTIAFVSNRDGNPEIYATDLAGTNVTRLTDNASVDEDPAWSPD